MTPRIRFRLWVFNAVALVAATHASLADTDRPVSWAAAVAGLCLAMSSLILTTPPNAIRLPKRRSVLVLTLLTAALYGHAALASDVVWPGAFGSIASVATAGVFAALSVRRRYTPWWVAPLWWNPLMVGPFAFSPVAAAAVGVGFMIFAGSRKSAVH